MSVFTEGRHAAEFVLSEAMANRSRGNITIKSGAGVIEPGTVLGRIDIGSATTAVKAGGNTGGGTITMDGTNPVRPGAKPGVYTVRCVATGTNSGTFRVEDPDGYVLGEVVVGATFDDDVKFSIADVGTDFAAGDGFDITVAEGSGKFVPAPNTSADGSHIGAAINLYRVDATDADQAVAALVRDSEVNGKILTYESSVDDAGKKAAKAAQLEQVGIIVR